MATIEVDPKALLAAGAHFGHKTSRWHQEWHSTFIRKRAGTHIIDLTKTATLLEEALGVITEATSKGGQVLLVSTKKQSVEIIKAVAA